ncbi:MAG: tetratricopeptide repeat-containing sensor histidine kinase [Bacteroidota bacterium]
MTSNLKNRFLPGSLLVLCILLGFCPKLHAQDKDHLLLDSLKNVLDQAPNDSLRLKATFNLVYQHFIVGEYNESIQYNEAALELSKAVGSKPDEADALERFGVLYMTLADFDKALENQAKAAVIRKELGDIRLMAGNYSAMSNVYQQQSRWEEATQANLAIIAAGEEIGDRELIGTGLLNLGLLDYKNRRYHHSISRMEEALEHFYAINYGRGIAFAYNNLAIAHRRLGHLQDAMTWFTKMQPYTRESDVRGRARLAHNIGYVHRLGRDFDQALPFAQEAYLLRKSVNDEVGVVSSAQLLGNILVQQGQYAEARPYLKEAFLLAQARENPTESSAAYLSLGIWHARQGTFDSALIQFDRGIAMAQTATDTAIQARIHETIGNFFVQEGLYPQALEGYLASLQLIEGNAFGKGTIYRKLGEVLAQQKEWSEAIEYYEQSIVINESIDHTGAVADILVALGDIYREQEEYERSLDYYQQSLALREEEGIGGLATVWQGLGATYLVSGQPELGNQFLNQALERHRQKQNPEGMAETYLSLAQLNEGTRQGLSLAVQALEQAEISRQKDLIRDAHQQLAAFYDALGQQEKAYYHYKRYRGLQDSLFNRENVRQLAQLELGYAFDQEKDRIARDREQEELRYQAELDRKTVVQYALMGGAVLLLVLLIQIGVSLRRKQRQNRQIAGQNVQINEQNTELKSLGEFKDTWTNMVAHDMKNSLNNILSASSTQPENGQMTRIHQSSEVLLSLVSNMLEVQKLEEANVALHTDRVAVHEWVEKARARVAFLYQMGNVKLEVSVPEVIHLQLDEAMMVRVLVNLLSNAAKYSPAQSTVTLTVAATAQGLELAVADEGEGIPEADLPHVFEKFYQAKARTQGSVSSNGLGLTYCKLAVEAHGGSIAVHSQVGEGTTFSLHLPQELFLELDQAEATELVVQDSLAQAHLSEQERVALLPYAEGFQQYQVFEAVDILNLLQQLPADLQQSDWKQQVEQAVISGDATQYEALLQQLGAVKSV